MALIELFYDQPNVHQRENGWNELWYTYMMEYHSVITRNELLKHNMNDSQKHRVEETLHKIVLIQWLHIYAVLE